MYTHPTSLMIILIRGPRDSRDDRSQHRLDAEQYRCEDLTKVLIHLHLDQLLPFRLLEELLDRLVNLLAYSPPSSSMSVKGFL